MNSKLMNKKLAKRIPLRTSFIQNNSILPSTSRDSSSGNSLYAAINCRPISAEEYNKVLMKNQRLAKENACLKLHVNSYKESLLKNSSEMVDCKQELSAAKKQIKELKAELKNKNVKNFSDQIQSVVNLLMEDYMVIDGIRAQINEFGQKVETAKGIMSSLQTLIESDDRNFNESLNLETSSDRLDSIRSSNSSIRLSLTSQEIDVKRRLSSERIRRDFHILNELSTILEISTEQRVSSLSHIPNDTNKGANNEIVSANAIQRESVGFWNDDIIPVPTITATESVSATTDNKTTKTKAKKEKKPKNKTKADTKADPKAKGDTKPKKKIEKQTKSKSKPQVDDPNASIYDFNDDEANKENIIPVSVVPAQRHSKRIRAKRYSLHEKL